MESFSDVFGVPLVTGFYFFNDRIVYVDAKEGILEHQNGSFNIGHATALCLHPIRNIDAYLSNQEGMQSFIKKKLLSLEKEVVEGTSEQSQPKCTDGSFENSRLFQESQHMDLED